MSNKQRFVEVYTVNFITWLLKQDCKVDLESAESTLESIFEAIFSDNYTVDIAGLNKTCRNLGIKCTYKAISEYLAN
jgi:hypothetical protein